jgi:hypothetical protein
VRIACLCLLIACSGGDDKPKQKPAAVVAADAGVPGIREIKPYDPASGMHLDEDVAARPATPPTPIDRPSRPIDITLRSTPTGAQAAVDGTIIGNTPAYWMGEANGREHEFTFVLNGYGTARYRFVPITSGVVHAKLERIVDDTGSATMPPQPFMQDKPRPVPPVAPPPAPIAPPDATTVPIGPQP